MAERRVHLRIEGKVQGVFFRESTKDKALELGLKGWVRNLNDGSVEAIAQGSEDAVAALIDYVHHGPPRARVTQVSVEDAPPDTDVGPFVVER